MAEHEISKLAVILSAVACQMGISTEADAEVENAKTEVEANTILDRIEAESS